MECLTQQFHDWRHRPEFVAAGKEIKAQASDNLENSKIFEIMLFSGSPSENLARLSPLMWSTLIDLLIASLLPVRGLTWTSHEIIIEENAVEIKVSAHLGLSLCPESDEEDLW